MPGNTPQQIQTPADVASFYSSVGLPPASASGDYMASPSTAAQVGALYSGILPIASGASRSAAAAPVAPGQFMPTTAQPNFFESAGISPARVNSIGAPLSAYVDTAGRRVVAPSSAAAAAAAEAQGGSMGDYSDPVLAAYRDGGEAAAQAEYASERQVVRRNVPADWSVANQGATGLFGVPMSPNQPEQAIPTVSAARMPLMASAGSSPSMPIMAAAAPPPTLYSAPNGYVYQSNGNGGYANVGVAPAYANMTPSQQYASIAAKAIASQPNGNSNNTGNFGGFGNNRSLTESGF